MGVYFDYINQLSIGATLLSFAILWMRRALQKSSHDRDFRLEVLLASSLAVATVPTSIALIACAFDTSLIPRLTELHLYILVAGAALLFIAVMAFAREW